MSAEHRTAIEIAEGVCLDSRAQEVRADGKCGRWGMSSTHAPEPVLPAVQKPRPAWTLVKKAGEGQDFYECVALSEVARRNPGPKEARIKEIAILFDYEAEHTLVYNRWLADIDVEVLPTAPVTVTSSLGRPVETRQIAIIPLESEKKGGESVVIAAWVVEESAWSQVTSQGIKELRERFETRPLISMAHTYRKRAPMDLVVGRDNRKIFPEVAHEGCLKGDDLFICSLLFKPGQVVCGAAQKSLKWTRELDDPEDAKKPEFRSRIKAKPKARARKQPGKAVIARRVSMTSSAGQSPHHGLQGDIWGAEGGSSCRGETPMPSDLEAGFSEPEVHRHVKVTGDADFCREREVLEILEPEGPAGEADADILAFAVGASLQVAEERVIYFLEDETPVVRPDERAKDWEADSDVDREPKGAARGLSSPARFLEIEQRLEEYLRVATPDIEALFPRPVCDITCRRGASADDTRRYLDEYGAKYLRVEQAEQEYRARREQAKVWRRERDEEVRRELEAKAQQLHIWQEELARRAEGTLERSEEERKAEEKRRKKAVREQLKEQKRNEEKQQLEEKRRKVEAKKKEEKERREAEKQKLDEEARRIRRKEVEAATAKAKKEKEERDRRKELKARVAAEEYNLFLVKESEREQMLAEEAKRLLTKKSEEADRAREAKAEKDWQELQEKESAEGVPVGAPVFRYRSIQADHSREMLESMGNLRDRWSEAPLERCNWFDSDLCILEPTNSMQLAAFKQLKFTGLLCSRFSPTVRKGRRFFTLAGEDAELPNGRGDKRREASRRRQQRPASPAASASDGGSRVEGSVAEERVGNGGAGERIAVSTGCRASGSGEAGSGVGGGGTDGGASNGNGTGSGGAGGRVGGGGAGDRVGSSARAASAGG
jgi:hypothetical protein